MTKTSTKKTAMDSAVKTLSTSKLQISLARTLKDATAKQQPVVVTYWRNASHIIVPVGLLSPEILASLPPGLLTQPHKPLAEEVLL